MAGTRTSISISQPNESWLQSQIDNGEYTSRSEAVNDLIRKAREKNREVEYIRTRLIASEKAVETHGWVVETQDKMLADFKERARKDGKL